MKDSATLSLKLLLASICATFLWSEPSAANCSINLQLETCDARKSMKNSSTTIDNRMLIPIYMNDLLDNPVVHTKPDRCFALADIVHKLCRGKEPTLASFIPTDPTKIDETSAIVIGETGDSRFTLIPSHLEVTEFMSQTSTDAKFLLSHLPNTSTVAQENKFIDLLRPQPIIGGQNCTSIGKEILDGNETCGAWSQFSDVISRNSTEMVIQRAPKSTVTLMEKLCSESTSCFSSAMPTITQRSNSMLAYLREIEQVVPRLNAGFCAPTAVTMLLLGLKGENPGANYGNSFDKASPNYIHPATGKIYPSYTRQIIEAIHAMGTDVVSGFTVTESMYKALEVFTDRIVTFNNYTGDGIIAQLRGLRTPFGIVPLSKSGLDVNHAIVINGFSGNNLRIYDPWGRVYLISTTVKDLPNQKVLSLLSQKPTWQMFGDFQNITLLSTLGNTLTFSGPTALDAANSFLIAAAIRGFSDFALQRRYLAEETILQRDAVVLNHISGAQGYVYAQGTTPVYFKKGDERLFPNLRDGDYWESLRNKIVDDYLSPDNVHILRGLIRTYRSGEVSALELRHFQNELDKGASLASIRLKLLGDSSVQESMFRAAIRTHMGKFPSTMQHLYRSDYESELVTAMMNGRTWEDTTQIMAAFDNFIKGVVALVDKGGIRYSSQDFIKFYKEIEIGGGSFDQVNMNISAFLDQVLSSPEAAFGLCNANSTHLRLSFKEYLGREMTNTEFETWCKRIINRHSVSKLAEVLSTRSIFGGYATEVPSLHTLFESDPEGARILYETPEFRAQMKASPEACTDQGKVATIHKAVTTASRELVSSLSVGSTSFSIERSPWGSYDAVSFSGVSVSKSAWSWIPGATQAMSDAVARDRVKSIIIDPNKASIKFATTKYKQYTISFSGISHLVSDSQNHIFEDVYWMELFKDEKGSGLVVSGMGKNYGSNSRSNPLIVRTDKYYFACQGLIEPVRIASELAKHMPQIVDPQDGVIGYEAAEVILTPLEPRLWKHHKFAGYRTYRNDGELDDSSDWILTGYGDDQGGDYIFLGKTPHTEETFYKKFFYSGQEVKYAIRPIVFDKRYNAHVELVPDEKPMNTVARVLIPPKGTSYISRRTLNFISCSRLELEMDFRAHNRCGYSGPGSKAGFLDFEKNLFVDQFEVGCNESSSVKSGSNGCLKNGKRIEEYAKVAGWLSDVGISAPNLFPITQVSAPVADQICKTRKIENPADQTVLATGRLPSMAEWRTLSYMQLPVEWNRFISEGRSFQTIKTVGNKPVPRDLSSELAQWASCSHKKRNYVTGAMDAISVLQKTSLEVCSFPIDTAQTVWHTSSPLDLRDMGTNVSEWVSDSVSYNTNCDNFSSHVGTQSLVNPANKDLDGIEFGRQDDIQGDLYYPNVNVRMNTHFHPLLGIPRTASHGNWPGSKALSLSRTPIANETFSVSGGNCNLSKSQIAVGGSFKAVSRVGVYNTRDLTWGQTAEDVGFRCVFPAE